MDLSSVQNLCFQLISSAFQRCRLSEDMCVLSVVLASSPDDPPVVQISISDTGVGSNLEEFQSLTYSKEFADSGNWDGQVFVRTTCIEDNEIYHYHLNLGESLSGNRLRRLPSKPKNGSTFSGTEVHVSISESVDHLLAVFVSFLEKMLILNIPNVVAELMVNRGDVPCSNSKTVFAPSKYTCLSSSSTNVERLKSGFEEYVLKLKNNLNVTSDSCYLKREHLKIGSGVACSSESSRSGLTVEALIIISEFSESSAPCLLSCNTKTEVLYFKDFCPCSVSPLLLNILTGINWKSYGLSLGRVVDKGSCVLLEWENLPPLIHIDMILHCYQKHAATANSIRQPGRDLLRRVVRLALDDMKEKYPGILLSAHAIKSSSYAPDLARTITDLVLSSNDSDFQKQCFSILGFQPDSGNDAVEDGIKQKIIKIIETNDRNPRKYKDDSQFLFEDDGVQEAYYQTEEYKELDVIGVEKVRCGFKA